MSKRSKTKLVLNADSKAEFEGWHKTLKETCRNATSIKPENEEVEKRPYENVEIPITCTRGRDPLKVKNKVPIPTPRNITPSREQNSISSGSQGQSFDSIPINIDDSPKHDKIKTSSDHEDQTPPPSKKNSLYLDKYNHLRRNEVSMKKFR